ncbi:hypothetical protein PENSPDRAFT_749085 [Peniophora sp. CONT]|nr:hypothetical protein PENSPDRAFT_749085 [Peniophora sp. CONT]
MDSEAVAFCVRIGGNHLYLRIKKTTRFQKLFNYIIKYLGLEDQNGMIRIINKAGDELEDGLLCDQDVEFGDELECVVDSDDTCDAGLYLDSPTDVTQVVVTLLLTPGLVAEEIQLPGMNLQEVDLDFIEWRGSLLDNPDELVEWDWEDHSLVQERETGALDRYLKWNFSIDIADIPPEEGSRISAQWNLNDKNSVVLRFNEVARYVTDAMKVFNLDGDHSNRFFIRYYSTFVEQTYIAIRFLDQNVYEQVAPLSISPAPDVMTRIVLLFRKVQESEVTQWPAARERYQLGPNYWKDVVGADERAGDATLYRAMEWRAVEIVGDEGFGTTSEACLFSSHS